MEEEMAEKPPFKTMVGIVVRIDSGVTNRVVRSLVYGIARKSKMYGLSFFRNFCLILIFSSPDCSFLIR